MGFEPSTRGARHGITTTSSRRYTDLDAHPLRHASVTPAATKEEQAQNTPPIHPIKHAERIQRIPPVLARDSQDRAEDLLPPVRSSRLPRRHPQEGPARQDPLRACASRPRRLMMGDATRG